MTRREELREAYEDAYFALLMDEVAEMEGARWEARLKELENDPSAAVPESTDRRCLQTIDRCFARKKRRKNLRAAGKVLNRIAVLIAVVSVLFTTVMAVSADIRAATLNLLITVNERYTEMHMDLGGIDYEFKDVLEEKYFSKIYIGWLPEGFLYAGGVPDMNVEFENEDGYFIKIDCSDGNATVQVDTENADKIEYIEINGHKTLKILKNGYTNLVLANEEKHLFVEVFVSDEISSDTALRIMENILFL